MGGWQFESVPYSPSSAGPSQLLTNGGFNVTIQEAIQSGKSFKLEDSDKVIGYYAAGTGSFTELVSCDYFVVDGEFSTSLDLYASELLSDKWETLND